MSARVDKFCDDLKVHLNAMEARVESAKANLQALPDKVDQALQERVDEARAGIQAQKERVAKARADLRAWEDQKNAETNAMIRDWKAKHESKKLNARADLAEAYAEAALCIALASIDEAEAAILDAVSARHDAESAA